MTPQIERIYKQWEKFYIELVKARVSGEPMADVDLAIWITMRAKHKDVLDAVRHEIAVLQQKEKEELMSGKLKKLHVNQHVIRKNKKTVSDRQCLRASPTTRIN